MRRPRAEATAAEATPRSGRGLRRDPPAPAAMAARAPLRPLPDTHARASRARGLQERIPAKSGRPGSNTAPEIIRRLRPMRKADMTHRGFLRRPFRSTFAIRQSCPRVSQRLQYEHYGDRRIVPRTAGDNERYNSAGQGSSCTIHQGISHAHRFIQKASRCGATHRSRNTCAPGHTCECEGRQRQALDRFLHMSATDIAPLRTCH